MVPNYRTAAQMRQQEYSPLPPPQQSAAGPSSLPFDVRKLGYEDMKKMLDTWQDEQKKVYGDAQRRQSLSATTNLSTEEKGKGT